MPRNRLLAALPAEDLARLWPQLKRVELPIRAVLYAAEQPITEVYFPESGHASMLACLKDGAAFEVGQIGLEGMIGLAVLFGDDRDDLEAMVQNPGTALQMSAAALREALESIPSLRFLLLRYALAHVREVARMGVCNGCHSTSERLARWLLMTHDRTQGDTFPMTQELLAMMLGVRRAGITVAAGALQKAGLIHYARGHITVTDPSGLETVACECYGTAHRAAERFQERQTRVAAAVCD
jgi:CRP-like cAMP-binding protein